MPALEGSVAGEAWEKSSWQSVPRRAPSGGRAWPGALVAALVLAAVALFLWWQRRPWWLVAVPAVAAVVVPVLMMHSGGRALRWVQTVAEAVRDVLVRVLFGILAIPMVLVPSLLTRASSRSGLDPDGRWSAPALRRGGADVAWSNDRPDRPGNRWWLAAGLAAVVCGSLLFLLESGSGPASQGFDLGANLPAGEPEPVVELAEPVPAGLETTTSDDPRSLGALDDDPWWFSAEHRAAADFLADQRNLRYENPYRILDMSSRYINVVGGRRSTWQPPSCDGCRRPVVWFYGGSTAFGVGQRDDHTIASELARVAHGNGIDLEVHNRGLFGFTQWQEAERLAWDLTSEQPPDLVIFYDGVNEIYEARDPGHFWYGKESPADSALVGMWRATERSLGRPPPGPPSARLLRSPQPNGGALWRGLSTIARYDRARELSRRTAAAAGVPVRYVWQPTRYERPLVEGEPHWGTDEENNMRLLVQVIRENLPDDVVDLTGALDETLVPVFTDDVHHDELAARVIAEAMFDQLREDLAALHD